MVLTGVNRRLYRTTGEAVNIFPLKLCVSPPSVNFQGVFAFDLSETGSPYKLLPQVKERMAAIGLQKPLGGQSS